MEISDCIYFLVKHFPYATDKIGLSERLSSSAVAPCTCLMKFKIPNQWCPTSDRASYINFYRDSWKFHTSGSSPLPCTQISTQQVTKMQNSLWQNRHILARFSLWYQIQRTHNTCGKEPSHFCLARAKRKIYRQCELPLKTGQQDYQFAGWPPLGWQGILNP